MLANLDIDLLRTFVTVVESGSFTRTGEALGRPYHGGARFGPYHARHV